MRVTTLSAVGKRYDKQVDLEPTEYTYEGKHEPAFGPNALQFLIVFLLGFPVSAIMTFIVTGQFPYWLRSLLE